MTEDNRHEQLKTIALQCLSDEGIAYSSPVEQLEDLKLLGSHALCDSMGLVSYLVALEEQVNASFNVQISLMSERAMSMERSPFRNMATLLAYTLDLVKESQP
jgi:hypothetical protein